MNYIYDIFLNFNEIAYDFFEWEKNDQIIHIKKIPIFKTNSEIFKKIISNNIRINEHFLEKIYNKTELFKNCKIDFATLISDNNNIIGLLFNKNGICIKKSFLHVLDELEILEESNDIKEEKINIKIISKINNNLKTRKNIKIDKFIYNEINNIDINKLKYIFFELFNKKYNKKYNIKKIMLKIQADKQKYKKLYNILKLTSTSNN